MSPERTNHGYRQDRGPSAYTIIKDLIGIGIFVSLLVMNYLNISILSVLDGLDISRNDYLDEPRMRQRRPNVDRAQRREASLLNPPREEGAVLANQKRPTKRDRKPPRAHRKIDIRKSSQSNELLVQEDDIIYKGKMSSFDSAPIVDEKHKLLFFSTPKVACTTFKFLFRRIMGVEDWDFQDGISGKNLPHNPKHNNLKYLWDYDRETATKMMTDPEWTRAIFVRDPKMRFLSAFLDKAVANYGSFVTQHCCPAAEECRTSELNMDMAKATEQCQVDAWDSRKLVVKPRWLEDQPCCTLFKECNEKTMNIEGFMDTIKTCPNDHWEPQNNRMEPKYWKYINFVGRMESINEDTEKLLKRVGAWDEYGKMGWGPHHNASMTRTSGSYQSHKTGSSSKIYQWFTPEKERMVEKFYADDYENQVFDFKATNLTEPTLDGKILKQNDDIYSRNDWDGAPIVVSKYKLIFFTQPKVAATRWKQAFRRMEGYNDWKEIGGPNELPHQPQKNGLKYLYDFPLKEAEEMMTSKDWTKAIFVRSPKDRFLSVYSHLRDNWKQIDDRCCPNQRGCSSTLNNMIQFIELMKVCHSTHWIPYSERLDSKWWEHINFVGKLENVDVDSENLLKSIGAWEAVGKSGWGENGNEPIFIKNINSFESVHNALAKYTPQADKLLNDYYEDDYKNKHLNFKSRKVHVMTQ